MPVPVWDYSDMQMDSVLSDDIWKKFDLDEPLDEQHIYAHQNAASLTSAMGYSNGASDKSMMMMMGSMNGHDNGVNNPELDYEESTNNQAVSLSDFYDKISCRESREIRHHDCMWAGLCISKEHNRTLPAKKEAIVNSKKVPAGRSLLISSRTASLNSASQQTSAHHQRTQSSGQSQTLYQQQQQQRRNKDGLESDGDSARPETPQSSESESEDEEDEDEEEDELDEEHVGRTASRNTTTGHVRIKQEIEDVPLIFKHDQISINDKLSECMTDDTSHVVRSAPVSEVTGQIVKKSQHHHHPHYHRHNYPHHHHTHHQTNVKVKIEPDTESEHWPCESNDQQQRVVKNEPDNWNTLNDHCYHQPSSKKLEHLGVQTPSDSEEEIDVVTFEKPCRPAALPTYPSIADQQHFQLTVKSALKEKPVTAPRPRGRPPSNGTPRKRSAPNDSRPTKRAKHRPYQSRSKVTKNNAPPTPVTSPLKSSSPIGTLQTSAGASAPGTSRSSSSDDEPDTEKRSLHNNMERQRRIELRNAFEDLRLLVPEIEDKEKAPKVAILRQAAIYCDKLTEIDRATSAKVIEMKRRQERLRARLSQLRRSLAMTR
ncbi:myc protein [Venturia canescens]|uniref:myc protein n=1 Tax=Venturia canescens TaxID=32260 RepID=UPI001C9C0228|nr:myc protein [Venturia canescens]